VTMAVKKLDHDTLEVIAETICGSGEGGGAVPYSSAAPYRTRSEIIRFFEKLGIAPAGQSSTRKWFVLESLRSLNDQTGGEPVAPGIESVLLRLANPQEYRGDMKVTQEVTSYLNRVLALEGLQIVLEGIMPHLRPIRPAAPPPKPKEPAFEPPPDFTRLAVEQRLAEILAGRWSEAQKCVQAGAYLSGVIMMGSLLEGLLLSKAESNLALVHRASRSPKDKSGKTKPLHEWSLSALIDVANEVGWLQGDVRRFSHALRESRNLVHPYQQRLEPADPDLHTCSICWEVVRAAVADLLEVEGSSQSAGGQQ